MLQGVCNVKWAITALRRDVETDSETHLVPETIQALTRKVIVKLMRTRRNGQKGHLKSIHLGFLYSKCQSIQKSTSSSPFNSPTSPLSGVHDEM